MTDKELVANVTNAINAAADAVRDARAAGLNVEVFVSGNADSLLPLTCRISRPLFDVGRQVDVTTEI